MQQSALISARSLNPILSVRGAVITIAVLYLLLVLALDATDIIASVVSISFLSVLAVAAAITVTKGAILSRNLNATFSAVDGSTDPEHRFVGGTSSICTVTIPSIAVPPFFLLQVSIEFYPKEVKVSPLRVSGRIPTRLTIPVEVVFPHRGVWGVPFLRCEFGDRLGLTKFRWKISMGSGCDVYPPKKAPPSLPILSSCHRAGDEAIDTTERQGDPFDLKPYHPSDGIKKILWKVYAKTGQLISRHPEQAFTPEGQVVIFALADKYDDDLCGDVLAYMEKLEDLNLDIFFGCEGMGQGIIARSSTDATALMLDSVWNAGTDDPRSVMENIEDLLSASKKSLRDASLERILIFVSRKRLWDEEFLRVLSAIGESLSTFKVSPVFLLLPSHYPRPRKKTFSLANLLFNSEPPQDEEPPFLAPFLSLCARNRWPTII